jgi:HD domain
LPVFPTGKIGKPDRGDARRTDHPIMKRDRYYGSTDGGSPMSDTRTLLNRITEFRQRLDAMPRFTPAPTAPAAAAVPDEVLQAKLAAGSRTQAVLEQSIRHLGVETAALQSGGMLLIPKAKRVLTEARELIAHLKQLADDPLLAGPPPGEGSVEADPLAIFYRETAAMMDPAVRLASTMPETASVQLRLADGLDGILGTVRQRLSALGNALDQRRRDADQVNRLAHLLVSLDSQQPVESSAFVLLASELIAESPATPMRFLHSPPTATQAFLGGPEFPAPARFVACHSLTAARVMARMLRPAPELREGTVDAVVAVLLHDVGMLRVSVDLLASPEPLSETQKREVETHCRASAEIIANRLPDFGRLVEAIAAHHERLDGTGYPSGLKAEQVPPLARLIAAADVYASMCCSRPHRAAHDPRTALTDSLLCAEQNNLDRFAVEKLLALGLYPVGSIVEMSDGAIGVVAANHQGRQELHLASRPVLNLLIDPQGHLLPVPAPIDLAECEGRSVVRTLGADERARLLGRHYPEWAA